jgi:hypothetical protein
MNGYASNPLRTSVSLHLFEMVSSHIFFSPRSQPVFLFSRMWVCKFQSGERTNRSLYCILPPEAPRELQGRVTHPLIVKLFPLLHPLVVSLSLSLSLFSLPDVPRVCVCPPPLPACDVQLRNDATGGIIVDTREPGLVALRAELTMRTLSPESLSPVTVRTTADPASPRRHLQATGIPHPPATSVYSPPTLRFNPAEVLQTKATHLWSQHPSKLPSNLVGHRCCCCCCCAPRARVGILRKPFIHSLGDCTFFLQSVIRAW